jgi:hypothetical protein
MPNSRTIEGHSPYLIGTTAMDERVLMASHSASATTCSHVDLFANFWKPMGHRTLAHARPGTTVEASRALGFAPALALMR